MNLTLSIPFYDMVYKCHVLIHQSVEMRLFALYIMALTLTIYLTLNLVVTTVLHGLLARANSLREAILIRNGIFVLSNENHLRINELNYFIESLAIDLN